MRLFNVVPRSFCWVVLVLLPFACSSDPAPSRDQVAGQGGDLAGGTGGSAGTAGPVSDSGTSTGTGGSTGEPDTLESLCRAAVTAQCQKRLDCGMSGSLECFGYANLCPEYYFGPGTKRTLETVRDCVAVVQQMACTDVVLSALPACLNGGERATGMGCAYGSQCAGSYCENGSRQCGNCAAVGQIGKACVATECEAGAFCNTATTMCESVTSIVHGAEGAKCSHFASPVLGCAGNLVCRDGQVIASSGTCTRLPDEGQPCTGLGGLPCTPGNVCVRSADGGGNCVSLASCGTTACDANSYCNYSLTPASCVPRATEGKPCMLSGDTGQVLCIAGTLCTPIAAGTQGVCLKPGSARAAVCSDTMPCTSPLQCQGGHCVPLDPASCN